MRTWKIGAITGGILLIAIGVLWLLQPLLSFSVTTILLYTWPLVCILLGMEILFLHFFRREQSLKVHWMIIILLFFIGGASLLFSFGKAALDEIGFSFQTASYQLEKEFVPTSSIEEIIVTIPHYDVTVTGVDEQNINISGLLTANMKNDSLLEQQVNNSFSMKQIGNKVYMELHDTLETFGFVHTNGTVHLTIPKNMDITVHVDQGNIRATNMKGIANLQTNNGDITVRDVTGSLTAQSYSGNIQVTDSTITEHSLLETSFGTILFQPNKNSSLSLHASTQSGDIQGNLDWKMASPTHDDENEANEETTQQATAQLGDGKHWVILSADSGNIIVNNEK